MGRVQTNNVINKRKVHSWHDSVEEHTNKHNACKSSAEATFVSGPKLIKDGLRAKWKTILWSVHSLKASTSDIVAIVWGCISVFSKGN